ncbi:hypothetical protein GN958_ATG22525 [Phytophthora infestans]|uniref:Uncharacterized protein n=1 Tax=Phytophthora infestans TaxID=4787 RepID=A0A8S9TJW4_PHYIN|nr:hypothetical protein GN958_ATG22525 [Phytophthora infestans]
MERLRPRRQQSKVNTVRRLDPVPEYADMDSHAKAEIFACLKYSASSKRRGGPETQADVAA